MAEKESYPPLLVFEMGDAMTQLIHAYATTPYYSNSSIRDKQSQLNIAVSECIEQCTDTLTAKDETMEHLSYLKETALEADQTDPALTPLSSIPHATYEFGKILHEQVVALKGYPRDGSPFPYYCCGRMGTKILMQHYQANPDGPQELKMPDIGEHDES